MKIGPVDMELKDAIGKYLEVVKQFDRPMPISDFQKSKEELESTLSAWEEDYHLHRHFDLLEAPMLPEASAGKYREYWINGLNVVAIVFHPSIRDVLE